MYAQMATLAFVGVEARTVEVQVRITPGQPAFSIVGLPDKAVAESRERVRNALHAVGLALPYQHLTVNLAPADLPKEGSHYDLAIILALMAAIEAMPAEVLRDFAAIGELALDGSIRPVPGALPAAIGANAMGKGLICAEASGPEASWASEDMDILAAPHLLSLVNHFKGYQMLTRPRPNLEQRCLSTADLIDIKGQESAKRVLEIAAAGGHNLLMIGPPGSGKSMLAARLPGLLPPLTPEEMLEVSMIHSLAGELMGGKIATQRPFRQPHHSASMAALVGGGSRPQPGEVSLAHRGVLFLDELPEFSPQALDSLRQPLETGETVIARANHRISYPSIVQLIAAMNPCRCGNASPGRSCKRGPKCSDDYQARISAPLLDRIDLQIEVPALSANDLVRPPPREGSSQVRQRVLAARERQTARFRELGAPGLHTNSECSGDLLEKVATPTEGGRSLLFEAAERLGLSARGYHRTLRVARTLADLDGVDAVERIHVAEALSYRGESLRSKNAA